MRKIIIFMQIPYRKPGKYMTQKPDHNLTQAKFDELQKKLDKLYNDRPQAAKEVARLAELGDFSENVEYQLAKGRLRRINQNILEIEYILKNADIIQPNKNNKTVNLGHTIMLEVNDKVRYYQILGSAEANPDKNIISQNSPLGMALLGKKVGDEIEVKLKNKTVVYKILEIK